MKGKVFLDTNIFVYSIDSSVARKLKRDVARKLVLDHIRDESGVISIQVLPEFFQVSTRKIQAPISAEEALEYTHYMASLLFPRLSLAHAWFDPARLPATLTAARPWACPTRNGLTKFCVLV